MMAESSPNASARIFPDVPLKNAGGGGSTIDGVLFGKRHAAVMAALRASFGCVDGRVRPKTSKFSHCSADRTLPRATIVPIFYGEAWSDGVHLAPSTVMTALTNIVSSPYLGFITQYVTDTPIYSSRADSAALTAPIVITDRRSALGAYGAQLGTDLEGGKPRWLPASPVSPFSRADAWLLIRILMAELIRAGTVANPVSWTRTLYVVFTPSGIGNDSGAPGYHGWENLQPDAHSHQTVPVPISVVGLVRKRPRDIDDVTEVFSHELAEAVGDPFGDGVRLLPDVQAAEAIADNSSEIGDYAQLNDPLPYRTIATGESVSAYWSDWHGQGVVPERYPAYQEFVERSCPDPTLVHQYHSALQHYLDTHGGDPAPLISAVRGGDVSILKRVGIVPVDAAAREALLAAAGQLALG